MAWISKCLLAMLGGKTVDAWQFGESRTTEVLSPKICSWRDMNLQSTIFPMRDVKWNYFAADWLTEELKFALTRFLVVTISSLCFNLEQKNEVFVRQTLFWSKLSEAFFKWYVRPLLPLLPLLPFTASPAEAAPGRQVQWVHSSKTWFFHFYIVRSGSASVVGLVGINDLMFFCHNCSYVEILWGSI